MSDNLVNWEIICLLDIIEWVTKMRLVLIVDI